MSKSFEEYDIMMDMGQGWFHADVDLEQFVQHVGAFLDMLILAAGYQSHGSRAMWTVGSLQKALDWACYLEEVLDTLPAGTRGDESKYTLNVNLETLFKNEPLPPGMTKISSAELERARSLLVEVLLQSLSAETAWLTANVIVMGEDVELKEVVTREISRRCMATGCVKSLQLASDLAAKISTNTKLGDSGDVDIWQTPQAIPGPKPDEFEEWINEGLVFIASAETMHKLSGATLIFSAGRTQWFQVFESLLSCADSGLASARVEIAELCCFFLASPRWRSLPRKIVSISCTSCSDSPSYENCWLGKEPTRGGESGETFTYESQEVEKYLRNLLSLEGDLWLQLHPILLAVALAGSSLLEDYIRYISENMLDPSSGCPGKCTCDICQRRRDARGRSWWLLMLNRHSGVDNSAANESLRIAPYQGSTV